MAAERTMSARSGAVCAPAAPARRRRGSREFASLRAILDRRRPLLRMPVAAAPAPPRPPAARDAGPRLSAVLPTVAPADPLLPAVLPAAAPAAPPRLYAAARDAGPRAPALPAAGGRPEIPTVGLPVRARIPAIMALPPSART